MSRLPEVERGCGQREEGCYFVPGGTLGGTLDEIEVGLAEQGYQEDDDYQGTGVRVFRRETGEPRFISILSDATDTYIVSDDQPQTNLQELIE